LLVTASPCRTAFVCLCADAQLHAFQGLFRGITLVPLLAPSLLSAISLIYWFGNQGVLKSWMQAVGVEQIYGAPGIVLAEIFSVSARADDPGHRAGGIGRAAV
jgi:ABC-type Fe3+ transport system permease subunit